ncbi:hypothetical protein NDU88_003837 [Pleurodeles waltl]|uniref:Uncharacterized protein n=1 Tax=Pleurodeles waltl TaxID=8319 RepID=A0AAV7M4J8_PLEWA|nr:hypothetical protein NDU88_003837 [Pleurodeles waltl]
MRRSRLCEGTPGVTADPTCGLSWARALKSPGSRWGAAAKPEERWPLAPVVCLPPASEGLIGRAAQMKSGRLWAQDWALCEWLLGRPEVRRHPAWPHSRSAPGARLSGSGLVAGARLRGQPEVAMRGPGRRMAPALAGRGWCPKDFWD